MKLVFGLDMGTSSIGYAVEELSYNSNRIEDVNVLACGVRVFSDGYNTSKKRISKSAERRGFRQARHRTYGKKQRRKNLINCLRAARVLEHNVDYKDIISQTKKKIYEKFFIDKSYKLKIIDEKTIEDRKEMIPYLLKSYAIDNLIELEELISIFFFSLNRRGFKSPKKGIGSTQENQNEESQIKKEIRERNEALINKGRTISQEILLEKPKLKDYYTSRQSHEKEFEAIKDRQIHNPIIPKNFPWDELKDIIFSNRSLRTCKHLIGSCSINPKKKRLRAYTICYQELNLKNEIRNICIVKPNSHEKISLSPNVKQIIFNKSLNGETVNPNEILEMEGLPSTKYKSKLIVGGKVFDKNSAIKSLVPSTVHKIITAIDDSNNIPISETKGKKFVKEMIARNGLKKFVNFLSSFHESWENGFISSLKRNYGEFSNFPVRLTDTEIRRISLVEFDTRFGSFGKDAVDELLNLTKDKWANISPIEYSELIESIRKKHRPSIQVIHDILPHPEGFIKSKHVNSPSVKRALYNLYKVINELIKKYGKPDEIRIESTRELNKPFHIRQQILNDNQKKFEINQIIRNELKNEFQITEPKRDYITKYKLWDEFNQTCPYCIKPISMEDFESAQIEHFIPASYLPTKSYKNLTISCRSCNQIKKQRTPWQAFGHDEDRWAKIEANLLRIKENIKTSKYSVSKNAFEYKMARMLSKEDFPEPNFLDSQLNDTRYITKLTAEYLSCLFKNDTSIVTVKPIVLHELKKILPKEIMEHYKKITIKYDDSVFQKQRADHRHHVLDAMVVALVNKSLLQKMTKECQEAYFNKKDFKEIKTNLNCQFGFLIEPFKKALDSAGISFGDRIRVRGPLHKQTPQQLNPKIEDGLRKGTWVQITRSGQKFYYENADIYKLEVWKKPHKNSWERLRPLNLNNAYLIKRRKKKLTRCLGKPDEQFVMEFRKGDVLLLNIDGKNQLYRVRNFDSEGSSQAVSVFDARKLEKKDPGVLKLSSKKLYEYKAKRVKLGVLGDYSILKSDEVEQ